MGFRVSQREKNHDLPDAGRFRDWLAGALPAVGVSHTRLGQDLDLGKNTLRDFMTTPGRDIRLTTAARVHDELQTRASAQGVSLPPLGGQGHG